jgi:hypothetical protein
MQEKKNKHRAFLLVILLVSLIAYGWFTRRESVLVDPAYFRGFDLQQVDSVIMQKHDDTVSLTYNGARWRVDHKWKADRDRIDGLFASILRAEPKRPVSAAMNDSIFHALEATGVKVTFFSKQQPLKTILMGGNNGKTQAFWSDPAEKKVFVMQVPGYRVYASGLFEFAANDWRDKRVFAFNWENFRGLAADIPAKPSQSFRVEMQNFQLTIPGISEIDTAKLNTYLDAVSLLTVDSYLSKTPSLDSLLSVKPIQILTVSDIGKREYHLKIFIHHRNEVVGLLDDKEWALFGQEKIRSLLRPKDFFIRH